MDLRELQKTYLDNLRKVTEDKLEIDYQTEDESSIVEIKGNENFSMNTL